MKPGTWAVRDHLWLMGSRGWRRFGRVARGALIFLVVLVASIATLAGIAISLARTEWGGERLRRLAVEQVNRRITGRLDIGRLSFGGNRVTVHDVTLLDPDGALVAELARAELDL